VSANCAGLTLFKNLFETVAEVIQQTINTLFPITYNLAHCHAFHHELGHVHSQLKAIRAIIPLAEKFDIGIGDVLVEGDA
jgi:hypothetical protein